MTGTASITTWMGTQTSIIADVEDPDAISPASVSHSRWNTPGSTVSTKNTERMYIFLKRLSIGLKRNRRKTAKSAGGTIDHRMNGGIAPRDRVMMNAVARVAIYRKRLNVLFFMKYYIYVS